MANEVTLNGHTYKGEDFKPGPLTTAQRTAPKMEVTLAGETFNSYPYDPITNPRGIVGESIAAQRNVAQLFAVLRTIDAGAKI